EMFLRSAAEISSRIENFTFLVVGEGKEARKLQDLAVELSLGDTVRFMGLRDDVPEILSISDVSVLCSYPVVETFPLSVLESMASAVPVVATSVGSIPEMLSDGEEGFLIPPGEMGALTEALLTLERDPGRRRTMGEKGRKKVVEGFSEERMVERYAELFGGLLKGAEKG
ncbi:MAG: glycosyltransferase, partial [Candidatus Krumholzibacteria bacterium]|nr:glycosyltransferase [Candidatus Krumholzibacteria bacterium]